MLANCYSLKEWHALLLEIAYALLVTDANCITYAQKVVNGRYWQKKRGSGDTLTITFEQSPKGVTKKGDPVRTYYYSGSTSDHLDVHVLR